MSRVFTITFRESDGGRSPKMVVDFDGGQWGMFLDTYETLEGVFDSSILFESIRDVSSQILAGSKGTLLVECGVKEQE